MPEGLSIRFEFGSRLLSMACAVFLIAAPGCSEAGSRGDSRSVMQFPAAEFSPEQARQAVLDLVRANPEMFIGNPDPDRLAKLPLVSLGDGEFSFGAFVISPAKRWYRADIGMDGPEPYMYHGTFVLQEGKWIATAPDLMRAHRM